MEITTQDLFLAEIKEKYTTKEQVILKYITEHDNIRAKTGERYYRNIADIKDQKIFYYDENGVKKEDEVAPNNKESNSWYKLLVDQKVQYLFGKDITLDYENDALGDAVEPYNNLKFNAQINELATEASIKGESYLHVFVDSMGEFKTLVIPTEQCIPIYKMGLERELEAFIRYYPIWYNLEKTVRVEYWDKETVTYYIEDGGVLVPEPTLEDNVLPHMKFVNSLNGAEEAVSFNEVPFIEFRNNTKGDYDLQDIKDNIDNYNKNKSELQDNIDQVQEIMLAVEGAADTPAAELRRNFNYHKIVKTKKGSNGVQVITAEIPIKARNSIL